MYTTHCWTIFKVMLRSKHVPLLPFPQKNLYLLFREVSLWSKRSFISREWRWHYPRPNILKPTIKIVFQWWFLFKVILLIYFRVAVALALVVLDLKTYLKILLLCLVCIIEKVILKSLIGNINSFISY